MSTNIVGAARRCALYMHEKTVWALWLSSEKEERAKFEADKDAFAKEMQQIYEESQTYHDGKWLMFEPKDQVLFDDFMKIAVDQKKAQQKVICSRK